MVRSVAIGRDCCAKTEDWDLLIGIIVLEDVAYGLNRIEILVPLHIEVMERVWLLGVTIRECEVDSDGEANLATAENILEERMPLLDLEVCQS